MPQRFLVVGTNAYRDPMDAVKDEKFDSSTAEKVEIEGSARVNELYRVAQIDEQGHVGGVRYVRNFDDIQEIFGNRAKIAYEIVYVLPYLPRKPVEKKSRSERQPTPAE